MIHVITNIFVFSCISVFFILFYSFCDYILSKKKDKKSKILLSTYNIFIITMYISYVLIHLFYLLKQ